MVAGEASADAHGAHVLAALQAKYGAVDAFGIGGAHLRAQGFDATFGAEQMALAGLTEVVWALPRMVRTLWALVEQARTRRPCVAVLIDLPDFNLPLAKRLKRLGIPVIYYISPQVWAWRASRVKKIRRVVDRMLVILPFEEAFYRSHGVAAEFVGHPLTEALAQVPDAQAQFQARRTLQMQEGLGPTIALLPGSRRTEVIRHLPTMLAAVGLLRATTHPGLTALLPVASTIDPALIGQLVLASGVDVRVIEGQSDVVLWAADAAMVCSGTATLEAALINVPMVVVYRVSALSYFILRRLVRVAHIALVNLIAQKRLVPELVQGDLTADALAAAIRPWLTHGPARDALVQELAGLRAMLGQRRPSVRVADAIFCYLPTTAPTKEPHRA
jgi:lipid-A-disaccharide synthase